MHFRVVPVAFLVIFASALFWTKVDATGITATVKIGLCGDGSIGAGEQCDGSALGGASCSSRGFTGGTLSCSASCEFNTSACTSSSPTPTPSSGGGGGGGGGGISVPSTPAGTATVSLSGRAYPRSTVTILKDAQVVASNSADSKADFQMSISNLSAGNYIFSVYSEDSAGNRSSMLTFPVSLTVGATTNIGGIFIAPTIDADKSQVKQGDNIAIFGQGVPTSDITITVNSDTEMFAQTKSDASGAYLYTLDTAQLEMGNHLAKSKAAVAGEISSLSSSVGFIVGTQNVTRPKEVRKLIGDLANHGRVNLIDFSIMAYWYRRPLSSTGANADLNHDGKVDLVDFSILMSHWTG